MNQPQGPPPTEPSTDVVEFGGSGPDDPRPPAGRLRRSAGLREPRVGWALGVLGAAALFASLVGEWATTTFRYDEGGFAESYVVGAGSAGNWGSAWMVGSLALAGAVGVCLAGPAHLRAAARAAGLAVAAALLLLMVAAAVEISSEGLAFDRMNIISVEIETEVSLGRGLFAAYAAVGLFVAALWLAPVPTPTRAGQVAMPYLSPEPARPGQPAPPGDRPGSDLTVQPAEPFIHPTNDHEWR